MHTPEREPKRGWEASESFQKYVLFALVGATLDALFFFVKSGDPLFGLLGIPFGAALGLALCYGISRRKRR